MQKYKIKKLNPPDKFVWMTRIKARNGYINLATRLKSEGMTARRSTIHKLIRHFEETEGGTFIAVEIKKRKPREKDTNT